MEILDYIFYRVYCFFNKRNDTIANVKAANFMFVILMFPLINLAIIVKNITEFEINMEGQTSWVWLPFVLPFYFVIERLFKKKESKFDTFFIKWNDEKNKTIKGWCIFLIPFVEVIIFLYSIKK